MQIEWIDIDELKRWPRNPKRHALSSLEKSIERFGFVAPIVVDERTGRIVAGHGRLDALLRMRHEGRIPPKRVKVDGDRWLVPVLRGIEFENEKEAEAYLLADNRLVELGGWDEEALFEFLTDQDDDVLDFLHFDVDTKGLLTEGSLFEPPEEFKEYDESIANDVEMVICPKCGHRFPK